MPSSSRSRIGQPFFAGSSLATRSNSSFLPAYSGMPSPSRSLGGSGGGGGAGATVGSSAAAGANTTSGGTAGTGGTSYGDSGGTVTETGTAVVSGANAGSAGSISFATVSGLVQATGGSIGTGSSNSVTATLATTSNAGDLLVVSAYGPGGCGGINVSDSASNTYTKESVTSSTNGRGLLAYVIHSAAITSVTVSCTNNSRIQFSVAEFEGFRPGFDQSHSGSSAGSTALSSGTTATTTGTADLVIGAAGWGSTTTLGSQTSGFALADTKNSNNNATEALNYKVAAGAGTFTFGGTLASSTDWAAFAYTFQPG